MRTAVDGPAAPFEVEWLGGVAEKHFRRLRPEVAKLPWGSLDASRYPAPLVERARALWTQIAITEYRAAVTFAEVLRLLLAARAPLDLVGMAGDFVADEASHVEIAARIAMELGGGVRIDIDTTAMLPRISNQTSALACANDRILVTAIAETFSEATVTGSLRATRHPLVRAALELVARDEARHTRFGWLYFDWAAGVLDHAERARLAGVGLETVAALATLWRARTSRVRNGVTTEGYCVDHVHDLGWMDSESFAARAKDCIRLEIVPSLARYGIVLDAARVAQITRA